MFYIIIGQSGAGKTTFVKTRFLTGQTKVVEDIIPYSVCENGIIALGRYNIGKRTEGTDTLSYSAKEKIKRQLSKLRGKDVVLEGDRINCREIFEYISTLNVEVKMYLITCKLSTSIKRLRSAGSAITPSFVKTTKTKSLRMFLDYNQRFHGEVINTDY